MEEDIKNVEYAIKHFNGRLKDYVSIENLLTKYKQLEQENNNFKEASIINDRLYQEVCNKNKELENDLTSVYISGVYDERKKWQSKIKEKIEELEKKIKCLHEELKKCCEERDKLGTETEIDNNEVRIFTLEKEIDELHTQKQVLQELLGEEK